MHFLISPYTSNNKLCTDLNLNVKGPAVQSSGTVPGIFVYRGPKIQGSWWPRVQHHPERLPQVPQVDAGGPILGTPPVAAHGLIHPSGAQIWHVFTHFTSHSHICPEMKGTIPVFNTQPQIITVRLPAPPFGVTDPTGISSRPLA